MDVERAGGWGLTAIARCATRTCLRTPKESCERSVGSWTSDFTMRCFGTSSVRRRCWLPPDTLKHTGPCACPQLRAFEIGDTRCLTNK